jgi:hypothetical protein
MIDEFEPTIHGIQSLVNEWETKLLELPTHVLTERRNGQNRTIKQLLGHLIDSASNNTHRIIHLQYQESPLWFPNYASNGNNDKWIAIQNYQDEDWETLVKLWRYANIHLVHVIKNVDTAKLDNQWCSSPDELVSLREAIKDYLRHFQLHLNEIDELISKQ